MDATQTPADIIAKLITVRSHVERTYAKIGATNRVGASLYALQHGLAAPWPVHH